MKYWFKNVADNIYIYPKSAPRNLILQTRTSDCNSAIKKVSGASGYKVYLRKGKKGRYKVVKTYKGNRTRTYKSRKLKRKKMYYVKVRAYKTYQSKKYFGKYSKTKKVKIPKK